MSKSKIIVVGGGLAYFERFVRGVGYLGHLKVHPVAYR